MITEPKPLSRQRLHQIKNQEAGRCLFHKERPTTPGSRYCGSCLEKARAGYKARYRRLRAEVGEEVKSSYICKKCGQTGHNSRTCTAKV